MPTPIRMLTMCLVVLGVSGCSKTAVMVGEGGVVSAVTEAPTFRLRRTLLLETKEAVENACKELQGSMLVGFAPRSNGNSDSGRGSDDMLGESFKGISVIFDLVESAIDIVPSHSVTLTVKCQD